MKPQHGARHYQTIFVVHVLLWFQQYPLENIQHLHGVLRIFLQIIKQTFEQFLSPWGDCWLIVRLSHSLLLPVLRIVKCLR